MFNGLQQMLIGNNNQDMQQFVTLQQFLLQIVADNSSNRLQIDHNLLMFQACVYGLNNSIFFNEETIDSLKDYLFSIQTPIDSLSLQDEGIEQEVKMRMHKRRNEVTSMLSKDSFALTQNPVMDDSLKHLDKIISVLRCKKKFILIRKKKVNEKIDNLPTIYNQEDKSVSFCDKGYYLTIKPQQQIFQPNQESYVAKFPTILWKQNILQYFSAFELFKLRGVSKMFREYVREIWLRVYQREMLEQLITADLCGDVDSQTKMLSIRRPFYHKFGICLKAILELLDWEALKTIMFKEDVEPRIQYLYLALYALLGFNVTVKSPQEIVGHPIWEKMKESFSKIQEDCNVILSSQYHFQSNKKLIEIRKAFVDIYDISRDLILSLNNRDLLLLQLFIKQLSIFSLLKNSTFLGNFWIEKAKEQMSLYSNTWSKKKGFLEGAYKILLFRYVKICDNKIEADATIIHQLTKEMALTKNLISFLLNIHLFENKDLSILDQLTDQDEEGNQRTNLLKITPGKGEEYLVHIDMSVKKDLLVSNLQKAKNTLIKQEQELSLLKQLAQELTKLEAQKLKKKELLQKQKRTQELLNDNIKKFKQLREEQLQLQQQISDQKEKEQEKEIGTQTEEFQLDNNEEEKEIDVEEQPQQSKEDCELLLNEALENAELILDKEQKLEQLAKETKQIMCNQFTELNQLMEEKTKELEEIEGVIKSQNEENNKENNDQKVEEKKNLI